MYLFECALRQYKQRACTVWAMKGQCELNMKEKGSTVLGYTCLLINYNLV